MSSHARGALRHGRLRVLALAALGAVLAIAATQAFAADPIPTNTCKGKTTGKNGSKTVQNYQFSCKEAFSSYTLVTSRDMAEFEVANLVYNRDGSLNPDDHFTCGGDIPSDGFACTGAAEAGHVVKGQYDADTKACGASKADRIKTWVIVAAKDATSDTAVSSEPFQLTRQQNCRYPKKKTRHRTRR